MLLFLDTEFTDLGPEAELLSLALVAEDGSREFYLERTDVPVYACSDFVQAEVLPHFGKYPGARCDYPEFCNRLRSWVDALPERMAVACDYSLDFQFLGWAVGQPWPRTLEPGPLMLTHWLYSPAFGLAEEAYFAQGYPRHHALHDARAIRLGFLAARSALISTRSANRDDLQ
jgi:hypothetical protein